jgi:hypothetical protein
MHKQELTDEDQSKVLISLYLREQIPFRHYRERLFEKIAKKALEQAEFLFKSRPFEGGESRIFVENRKLKRELASALENQKQYEA